MAYITITQEVREVNITIEQNGQSFELQPVLVVNGGGSGGGVARNYGNISGTYELDLNDFDSARAVLTGNTILDVLASSLPAVGVIADVKLLDINSTTAETLEFPVAWKVKGTFLNDGTLNQIAIAFRNYPTDGLIVSVFINDLP